MEACLKVYGHGLIWEIYTKVSFKIREKRHSFYSILLQILMSLRLLPKFDIICTEFREVNNLFKFNQQLINFHGHVNPVHVR